MRVSGAGPLRTVFGSTHHLREQISSHLTHRRWLKPSQTSGICLFLVGISPLCAGSSGFVCTLNKDGCFYSGFHVLSYSWCLHPRTYISESVFDQSFNPELPPIPLPTLGLSLSKPSGRAVVLSFSSWLRCVYIRILKPGKFHARTHTRTHTLKGTFNPLSADDVNRFLSAYN